MTDADFNEGNELTYFYEFGDLNVTVYKCPNISCEYCPTYNPYEHWGICLKCNSSTYLEEEVCWDSYPGENYYTAAIIAFSLALAIQTLSQISSVQLAAKLYLTIWEL